jgi:hypothetical protein
MDQQHVTMDKCNMSGVKKKFQSALKAAVSAVCLKRFLWSCKDELIFVSFCYPTVCQMQFSLVDFRGETPALWKKHFGEFTVDYRA